MMVDQHRITCGVIANLIIYAYLIYWHELCWNGMMHSYEPGNLEIRCECMTRIF